MATAIIGTGNIGGTLARHLVRGGEPVVLAAKDEANAAALAQELGELARAASVEAVHAADTVLLTVPSQLGVDYNAAMLETIAREIAPALGWSPKNLPDPVR